MTEEEIDKLIQDFAEKFVGSQKELEPELKKHLDDNLWDLLE